jgi:peptidase E
MGTVPHRRCASAGPWPLGPRRYGGRTPADEPTILATSGGLRFGSRTRYALGPLIHFAIELSGVTGRPRICVLDTAGGDQRWAQAFFAEAGEAAGVTVRFLNVYPMPNVEDPEGFVLDHDVVWVGGGSVANLLALWRLHGYDEVMATAWRSGVVLAGVSAGSICWHLGGTTDSFGPTLRPVTNGLGLLPFSNGVHYDSEPERRPLFQRLIADGVLPDGYATDDGVGLLYRSTAMVEAVTELTGKGAYAVRRSADRAVEERIEPRLLPGS